MLKKDFWYDLPKELIAQEPADPRDSARLMVLDRKNDTIEHRIFHDLPEYLNAGDVLVVNNFGRFSGSQGDHSEPFYYYLIKMPSLFWPWLPLVPFAVWHAVKRVRRDGGGPGVPGAQRDAEGPGQGRTDAERK